MTLHGAGSVLFKHHIRGLKFDPFFSPDLNLIMQFFLNLLCLGRNLCSKSNNLTNLGPAYQHNIDHFAPYGADQSGVRDLRGPFLLVVKTGP